MTLEYTLDQLMQQYVVIERNVFTGDAYGAQTPDNWQYLTTVRCKAWWNRSSGGARSVNRTYASPAREVPVSEGVIMVPVGTDVTEKDRFTRVTDLEGNVIYDATFTITAVLFLEDHVECNILETTLGV